MRTERLAVSRQPLRCSEERKERRKEGRKVCDGGCALRTVCLRSGVDALPGYLVGCEGVRCEVRRGARYEVCRMQER